MSESVEQAAAWVYQGVWRVFTDYFCVPKRPPDLPVAVGEELTKYRPDRGFLNYLRLFFWFICLAIDCGILILWIVVFITNPFIGTLLAIPALLIAVVPDVIAYVAIHLRYDTTWYVISQRSMRIRRGIWTIHETTITFENVQNVTVQQGPLQRWFGIADLLVETAGSGGGAGGQQHAGTLNQGLVEGVAQVEAQRLRDLILERLRAVGSAGLGDDDERSSASTNRQPFSEASLWTPEHLAGLRAIRDEIIAIRTGADPAGAS